MCIRGNAFYCVRKKIQKWRLKERIPELILLTDNTACTVVKFCDFCLRNVSQSPAQWSSLPGVSLLSTAGAVTGSLSYSPRGIRNAHPVRIHHELQPLTSVRPCVRALLAPISCTHKTCTTPLRAQRAAEAPTHFQVSLGLAWLLDFETPVSSVWITLWHETPIHSPRFSSMSISSLLRSTTPIGRMNCCNTLGLNTWLQTRIT